MVETKKRRVRYRLIAHPFKKEWVVFRMPKSRRYTDYIHNGKRVGYLQMAE